MQVQRLENPRKSSRFLLIRCRLRVVRRRARLCSSALRHILLRRARVSRPCRSRPIRRLRLAGLRSRLRFRLPRRHRCLPARSRRAPVAHAWRAHVPEVYARGHRNDARQQNRETHRLRSHRSHLSNARTEHALPTGREPGRFIMAQLPIPAWEINPHASRSPIANGRRNLPARFFPLDNQEERSILPPDRPLRRFQESRGKKNPVSFLCSSNAAPNCRARNPSSLRALIKKPNIAIARPATARHSPIAITVPTSPASIPV